MAYLRLRDYNSQIQLTQLNEVTGFDASIRLQAERTAQEELSTYLRQRWDVADEFRDTVVFSMSAIYKAKQLIELNFPAYSPTSTYAINDLVIQAGVAYICIHVISVAEAFNPASWTAIGNQYDLFFIPTPYPVFNYATTYNVGDFVFWKDAVYQCKQATILYGQNDILQAGTYDLVPFPNIFPDDSANGKNQWIKGSSYSFAGLPIASSPAAWSSVTIYTAGNRVTYNGIVYQCFSNNTDKIPGTDAINWLPVSWVFGDNRNQQLYIYMVSCVLYWIYRRIAPRNIPELIETGYNIAKDWLKDAAYGKVNPNLTALQPNQGMRVRSGGNIKKINNY